MSLPRRQFLSLAAAASGAALTSRWAQADQAKGLRVAVIGVNGRGQAHLAGLSRYVTAICDVDAKVLAQRVGKFEADHGRKVAAIRDYREIIDSPAYDAVAIATPNHTHALIGIAAIQAGKHVYVEKPVSHNVWEGRQLVAAAERSGVIVQVGTQSRSARCLQQAVEFVRSGKLGKVQYALGTCYKPRPPIGKLDQPLAIPDSIDYDLWCGPAAKVDLYRPNLHYDWHWDFNTGAGDMGNQGIHQMDVARWFLGHDALPPRTISIGGRVGYEDAGNTANSQVVLHDYPDAPIVFETRGLPRSKAAQARWASGMERYRGSQIGVVVQCEGGRVYSPNTYTEAMAYDNDGKQIQHWTGGGNHFANWVEAIAAGDASRLNGPVRDGHLSSSLCHVGNVSHRTGQVRTAEEIAEMVSSNPLLSSSFDRLAAHLRANEVDVDSAPGALTAGTWLTIDPTAEQVVDNAAAAKLWTREYRAGFEVPQVAAQA
ncbi:MAG: Gfo/Idh/MocA family oxidoreductase [Pirellulales bacterium]|nr:Gfo/Idh/MocA family oxidoreductase [Pirellulales bacterium]